MSTHEKPNPIPNAIIMDFRRRTGMGVLQSKVLLEQASPVFYERLIEAAQTQGTSHLNDGYPSSLSDPIANHPEFAEKIKQAEALAKSELAHHLEDGRFPRGFCHVFWPLKKRILREKFGIEWFTPAEMNPGDLFD